MALSDIDRNLLQRCLGGKPGAWEDFVDRYLGLVMHVITHTSQCRSIRLAAEDREDLCAEVFLALLKDDFAVLRRFRGQSSLATYLAVVARRVVVRELVEQRSAARLATNDHPAPAAAHAPEQRLHDRDEVERLMEELESSEAMVVKMYHLEGKSYQEISSAVGIAENSVGPVLSRARQKMRRASGEQVES